MAARYLISIVDDDASMREALVGLVRSLGYEVRDFASAEDFLASNDLGQFACAITDIQMPGMNGFELKRELSTHHGSLPVIMIAQCPAGAIGRRIRAIRLSPLLGSRWRW